MIVFSAVTPFIREDLLVMVAGIPFKYIELFVSNEIISPAEKTGTSFQMISLKALISNGLLFGVVIVRFPGEVDPGFVDAILQDTHQAAVVSQFSYVPAAFGRSTKPFPQ